MSTPTSREVGDTGRHSASSDHESSGHTGRIAFAWAFVGIPLAYGVFETAKKAAALFTG